MINYKNVVNTSYLGICHEPLHHYHYKVELLDWYEFVTMEITGECVDEGTITVNRSQGVRRSCSLSLFNYEGKQVIDRDSKFWYTKKFKLWTGIENEYTGDIYWFSQGVFLTTSVEYNDNKIQITGVDKFGLFTSDVGASVLEAEHKIYRDEEIVQVIRNIISTDLGNGRSLDPIDPVIDLNLCGIKVPYDISISAGQFLGDILVELALCLGADIFYDGDGRLNVVRGTTDTKYSKKGAQWVFGIKDSNLISIGTNCDLSSAVNKVTVFGTDADDCHHYYTAVNNDPTSQISISAIGVRTAETIETAMGYSDQRCREYAEYWLGEKSIITLSVNIECVFIPHIDVDKVVMITDDNGDSARYIVSQVNIPFGSTSNMSMSVTNVADLPYFNEI